MILLLLVGCNERFGRGADVLDLGIKAGQLTPRQNFERSDSVNVGLGVYLFQVQPKQWPKVLRRLSKFDKLEFKYASIVALAANEMVTASGDMTMLTMLQKDIAKADAIAIKTIGLRILQGLKEKIVIGSIKEPQTIYYAAAGDVVSGVGLDRGDFILHIEPVALIGLRRASKINVSLLHRSGVLGDLNRRNFDFGWLDFSVRMEPGQFFILASRQSPQKHKMIANTIFSSPAPAPAVRFLLVMCTLISE